MANDALFMALAQAKARPSKALRAVEAGSQAAQDTLGGYMQGKQIGQQLDQYKLLATPLGSMYPDASQIPFGLSPNHTVKDLLTLAPAMENYVPSNLIRGAAGAYGASTTGGGSSSATSTTPAPTTGGTPQTPGMTLDVPAGGMGMKGFQNVVLPALKAGQEERQFQQRQGSEESRFQRGKAQQESEFERGHMSGAVEKIAPQLTTTGNIQDDINTLVPLFKGYQPIPFLGKAGASIASASGTSTFGGETAQRGKQIQQIAPALAAKVNYELNRRFNSGEAAMLQQQVIPNAGDNEQNAMQKIGNLQRLVSVMKNGDIQNIQMVASAIAGRPINPQPPVSTNPGQGQSPANSGSGDPEADAAIAKIQASSLNPQAKQMRINAVRARMGR